MAGLICLAFLGCGWEPAPRLHVCVKEETVKEMMCISSQGVLPFYTGGAVCGPIYERVCKAYEWRQNPAHAQWEYDRWVRERDRKP